MSSPPPASPLTLERLRADIAAALHEDPAAVGLDDNLMELGLDSMRAMTLVVQWSAAGVPLDFSEFAERLTLAGWWEIVQRRQTPPAGPAP